MEFDRLLKVPEVAEILAISERTAWKLSGDGVLPTVRIGGSVRVDPVRLQQFISAGGEVGESCEQS